MRVNAQLAVSQGAGAGFASSIFLTGSYNVGLAA